MTTLLLRRLILGLMYFSLQNFADQQAAKLTLSWHKAFIERPTALGDNAELNTVHVMQPKTNLGTDNVDQFEGHLTIVLSP